MGAADVLELLDRFCTATTARDPATILALFAADPDVVVVTSEGATVRGPDQLEAFVTAGADGPTTYAWSWQDRDVVCAGSVAWVVARGRETRTTAGAHEHRAYRMTLICERRAGAWRVRHLHGSSPDAT